MSPLMQQILESKNERRRRLMALPFPEKVRIVEKLRAASRQLHHAARMGAGASRLMEEPPPYGDTKTR